MENLEQQTHLDGTVQPVSIRSAHPCCELSMGRTRYHFWKGGASFMETLQLTLLFCNSGTCHPTGSWSRPWTRRAGQADRHSSREPEEVLRQASGAAVRV